MAGSTVSVRYYILGLLTQRPMSGYDIRRFLKSLSWLIGSPSFGSLYPALRALLEEGLVTVETFPRQDRQPRKIYSITEAGRQALQEWINQPAGPEISLKAFLMRLILAGSFSHTGLVSLLHQRRSQVAAYRTAMEQALALMDEAADLGQRLTLEYGLAVANAELAWLDRVLDRVSQQSLPAEVV
ncbi:MAG TPA: PadR family transcriptional regulator [Anaerolineae bacterium]|nr:PadR family transcriptional regulator [Anaerolineae bacterium]